MDKGPGVNKVETDVRTDQLEPEEHEALRVVTEGLAVCARVLRNDKPKGVFGSPITARPRQGVLPRYTYQG